MQRKINLGISNNGYFNYYYSNTGDFKKATKIDKKINFEKKELSFFNLDNENTYHGKCQTKSKWLCSTFLFVL